MTFLRDTGFSGAVADSSTVPRYILVRENMPVRGLGVDIPIILRERLGTSQAQSSEQALSPQSSWVRFSLRTRAKRVSGCSGFLPQGKLTGWVRINTVKESKITIVVKIK